MPIWARAAWTTQLDVPAPFLQVFQYLWLCWGRTLSPHCSCAHRGKELSTPSSRRKEHNQLPSVLHYFLLGAGANLPHQWIWWWNWADLTQSLSLSFLLSCQPLQGMSVSSPICYKLQGLFLLHIGACDLVDKSFTKRRSLASLFCHKSKAICVSPVSYFLIHLNFGRP